MIEQAMQLSPTTEKFILHWGEMGSKWGVNRTISQIHALLYLIGEPMHAEEIAETLGVARSNVSNSIKELQNMNVVQTIHKMGDRRDYFTTSTDVWELARLIVEDRYRKELAPTVVFLNDLMQSPEFANENEKIQQRVKDTHNFIDTLTSWANEMLKLSSSTLSKVLKLGASIQKFLK
ncbi:GbsR/MarR family transcriptional regulator [Acinetobacter sp. c3-l95]|uniref:GbsR/MarR family transcriptional regulator n=1 Tax=Acinetobacter sp. c3-l95 TaxID=3342804 RepID=UPI0035BB1691